MPIQVTATVICDRDGTQAPLPAPTHFGTQAPPSLPPMAMVQFNLPEGWGAIAPDKALCPQCFTALQAFLKPVTDA